MTALPPEDLLTIEAVAARAWQAEETVKLDGWLLRSSRGVTWRGNSVLPIAHGTEYSIKEKFALAEAFYAQKGQPCIFQLTQAAQPETLLSLLAANRYQNQFFTEVHMAPPDKILKQTQENKRFSVQRLPQLTDSWLQTYLAVGGYEGLSAEVRNNILKKVPSPATFVQLFEGRAPAAIGLGVLVDRYLGIFCMETEPHYRRRGAATHVIHSLVLWAKEQGVGQVYLQVEADNAPALSLYQQAGFNFAYRYWYAKKQ